MRTAAASATWERYPDKTIQQMAEIAGSSAVPRAARPEEILNTSHSIDNTPQPAKMPPVSHSISPSAPTRLGETRSPSL